MQQAKAANAAGVGASAQTGLAAKAMESTTGAALSMSGRPQSEEPTPKIGRRRAKAQSLDREAETPQSGRPRPGNKQAASQGGLKPKPKKGMSAAASTQAAASKKTVGKPGRPPGRSTQMARRETAPQDAIALLQSDHRTVEQLFQSYESAQSAAVKEEIAQQICIELIVHTHLEEEIFYPACRDQGVEDDALDEAQVEHDGAKIMIGDLLEGSPEDPYYDAKVKVLKEYIRHHVNEEEKADGLFSKARQASLDLDALGMELKAMKEELTAEGDAVAAAPLEVPSLQINNIQTHSEETQMPRHSSYMDEDDYRTARGRSSGNRMRDEEGRFMSDEDDYRMARSSRGRSMERDEQGRFMSDDDDDYQRRSSRGRGHGGWFGDPEGHAEAARQRRFSSRDDEDDERSYRTRGRGRSMEMERDEQGRFISDDEDDGRSSRSRFSRSRYDEDDDRIYRSSGRGRMMDRDEQGRFISDEDDDGRRRISRGRSSHSRSSQGHGGWYGDPRGHAEAARRGWQSRD